MLVFIIHCWIISFHPSPADSDHLFFLHNRYLESNDLNRPHDVYGKMEYNEIITAFKANGFEVHNEIRPTNTDPKVYAILLSMSPPILPILKLISCSSPV